MEQFAIDRDKAFTNFVHTDDWQCIEDYLTKYGIKAVGFKGAKIPIEVQKAGVYKAVQECIHIDAETKALAREKCIALGFKPTMWEE